MNLLYGLLFALLLLQTPELKSQVNKSDSAKHQLDQLVESKLLKAVRDIHNKLDLNAFSRAYSTETYVYEVYKEPDKKQPAYGCVMKVMRGAFIIEKYEFRANPAKGSIEVMDDKSKRYLPAEKWLLIYKDKVTEDEKNKK